MAWSPRRSPLVSSAICNLWSVLKLWSSVCTCTCTVALDLAVTVGELSPCASVPSAIYASSSASDLPLPLASGSGVSPCPAPPSFVRRRRPGPVPGRLPCRLPCHSTLKLPLYPIHLRTYTCQPSSFCVPFFYSDSSAGPNFLYFFYYINLINYIIIDYSLVVAVAVCSNFLFFFIFFCF